MKNFTVRADTRVRIDINEILGFLETRQVNLSHKFLKDYLKALKKLEKNPYFQIRYKDIRCLPLEKFKYMIHFKLDEINNEVMIYAIISTHQNPDTHWL